VSTYNAQQHLQLPAPSATAQQQRARNHGHRDTIVNAAVSQNRSTVTANHRCNAQAATPENAAGAKPPGATTLYLQRTRSSRSTFIFPAHDAGHRRSATRRKTRNDATKAMDPQQQKRESSSHGSS